MQSKSFTTNFKLLTPKVCKTCQKEPRLNGRTLGMKCINLLSKQKEKLKKDKEKQRKLLRKFKKKEKRENHRPTLIKKADKAFSDFIRARDKYICQTCSKKLDKSNAHCSHFVGRMNLSTRWNEQNCICQCAEENIFKEGNKPLFALYLMKKYGNEIVESLVRESRVFYKPTTEDLKEIIKIYQEKLLTV